MLVSFIYTILRTTLLLPYILRVTNKITSNLPLLVFLVQMKTCKVLRHDKIYSSVFIHKCTLQSLWIKDVIRLFVTVLPMNDSGDDDDLRISTFPVYGREVPLVTLLPLVGDMGETIKQ